MLSIAKLLKINMLPPFDEDLLVQKKTFGGELFADPAFQGFLQTDRDGNPRGIIALDPRDLLK
jgi:hypothetical protein